jgi:biopolymer transport protein ExbD
LEELTRRLGEARAQYSGLKVLVRGDGKGQFQRVAEVLNACKQAGISELGISVRVIPPEKK